MAIDKAYFNRDYFQRYYRRDDQSTWQYEDYENLARFLFSYADMLGIWVNKVADIGAGMQFLGQAVRQIYPQAQYLAFDISETAINEYSEGLSFDPIDISKPLNKPEGAESELVVCRQVLDYVDTEDLGTAVKNLRSFMTEESILYVLAHSVEDWNQGLLDVSRSDPNVQKTRRHTQLYAALRENGLAHLGMGVFIPFEMHSKLFCIERGAL